MVCDLIRLEQAPFQEQLIKGNFKLPFPSPAEWYARYFQHLELAAHPMQNEDYKIPLLSHHVWLTNESNPREIRKEDFSNLQAKLEILDRESLGKWRHIFWTNGKHLIPKTVERLKSLNIEIRELKDYSTSLISYPLAVKRFVSDGKIGAAADLIRYDILKEMGGFYSDLNYVLKKSPEPLMRTFDFIADETEEGLLSIENYMITAKPHHPILVEVFSFVLGSVLSPFPLGVDVSGCENDIYTNMVTYAPFAVAVVNNVNQQGTMDLIIPYHYSGKKEERTGFAWCLLSSKEKEDAGDALSFFEPYTSYIETYAKCVDIKFGYDGRNGHTWTNFWQKQENFSEETDNSPLHDLRVNGEERMVGKASQKTSTYMEVDSLWTCPVGSEGNSSFSLLDLIF